MSDTSVIFDVQRTGRSVALSFFMVLKEEKEREQADRFIMVVSSQIAPHFLYNALLLTRALFREQGII